MKTNGKQTNYVDIDIDEYEAKRITCIVLTQLFGYNYQNHHIEAGKLLKMPMAFDVKWDRYITVRDATEDDFLAVTLLRKIATLKLEDVK